MLYPQDYDNIELDNQFKGSKPDETFCSLKLKDKSIDGSQFIFPPQEVSNLGLDSSHEINDDTECSSLRSVSEKKLQNSFCSQSSAGSIGQLVRKLETTSKLREMNEEKTRFSYSNDIEKHHLTPSESSIDIEECLRNSMASSISTVFEGQANRKRLPVWESTPIDCKSEVYQRNQVRPAQSAGLGRRGLGISTKGSGNGTNQNVKSNTSSDAPNVNLLMQQLQELLAVNENPLLLPFIIHLLNGQSVNASPANQLQKLASKMQLLNSQVGSSTNQTQSSSITLKDVGPEPMHSSSSESSSSRFCLPNPSRRSRTSNDPKKSQLLHEGIKNHINVERGMVVGVGTEKDEFEKKFCSADNFVGDVQNFGKLYDTVDSEMKFRSNQIMDIEKHVSPPSLAPLSSSSSSRATSSLPASMPLMAPPTDSPLLIPHPLISSKRMSQPALSSRSTLPSPSSTSPATLTQSLNTLYVKNKSFKHQLSDVFKFLVNLDSRGKAEEADCLGDDVTITLDDDEEDRNSVEDVNRDERSWLLKSISQTNTGQVVSHQTLDGLRVPYMSKTNNLMSDLNPKPTKEKLQAPTVKPCDDDDLLSISAYIIPSEVCKVAKLRVEKSEPTTSSELESPVTPTTVSSNCYSINQPTCQDDHKITSGIDSKNSRDTRGFSVQTRDECIQVGSGDLPGFEEQTFSSPWQIRKSFESMSIHLKKKLDPSGNFKKPSNRLFSHDERACGAFTPEELSLECPSTPSSSCKSSLSMVPKKIDSNGNVVMTAPNQWTITFEDEKFKGNSLNENQNLQLRKQRIRESLEAHQNLRSSKNCATLSLGKEKVLGNVADHRSFDKKEVTRKNLANTPKVIEGVKPTQLSNGHKVRSRTLESSKGRTIVKQINGKMQRKVSMRTT